MLKISPGPNGAPISLKTQMTLVLLALLASLESADFKQIQCNQNLFLQNKNKKQQMHHETTKKYSFILMFCKCTIKDVEKRLRFFPLETLQVLNVDGTWSIKQTKIKLGEFVILVHGFEIKDRSQPLEQLLVNKMMNQFNVAHKKQ